MSKVKLPRIFTPSPKYQRLVINLKKVQDKHSELGARDTEPEYAIQRAVFDAMKGEICLPKHWHLYSKRGSSIKTAEKELNAALLPLLEYVADAKATLVAADEFCWRI